jgi:RNA polymerase sigma factor (sigma-70 family)
MTMQAYLLSTRRRSDLADDDLLQQAQSGDQGAFEILVDRYSSSLLLLIYRLLRDECLAHDVLQHVFIQLYHSLPTLRPGGTLKAWLSRVAHNRCIDELRRRRPIFLSEIPSAPYEDDGSFLTALPDPDPLPQEQVEQHELREVLLEAIEMLPPHFRKVVRLRYAIQLSFREIAQALGIPEATAKTYFFRAKKLLRTLLETEFAGYNNVTLMVTNEPSMPR